MKNATKKTSLTLPKKLAYTAIRCAVGGSLACCGDSAASHPAADAAIVDAMVTVDVATTDSPEDATADVTADAVGTDATDATADVAAADVSDDAVAIQDGTTQADACPGAFFCGPTMADASCPGLVCLPAECPPGCGPFV